MSEANGHETAATKPRRRLLILVCTCQQALDRQERCRRTWLDGASTTPEVEVFFFQGGTRLDFREGVLTLPCADDYKALPEKVRTAIDFCLGHFDFDYIFKCDDDTYVHMDRLLAFPTNGKNYIGRGGICALGGSGYFLSRYAASIVSKHMRVNRGAEDLLVGRTLRHHGVHLRRDMRFRSRLAQGWPCVNNRVITTHRVRDDLTMNLVHLDARGIGGIDIPPDLFCLGDCHARGGSVRATSALGTVGHWQLIDTEPFSFASDSYCLYARAHSTIEIVAHQKLALTGFMPAATHAGNAGYIRFGVDHQEVATLCGSAGCTHPFAIEPGRHVLTTRARDTAPSHAGWNFRKP